MLLFHYGLRFELAKCYEASVLGKDISIGNQSVRSLVTYRKVFIFK